MLIYTAEERDGRLEVNLEGDLDIDATHVVTEKLIPLMECFSVVNLNFGKVPFVDSTGLGLLMKMVEISKEKNQVVTISHIQEDVGEIFELLQLPEILGEEVFI